MADAGDQAARRFANFFGSIANDNGIALVWWFLLTLRGSCGENHAALEQIEARSSMGLGLGLP